MLFGIMALVVICLMMALRNLFLPSRWKYKQISFENFVFLGCTYAVIMLGFGLLFMLLELNNTGIIMDNGNLLSDNFFEKLSTSMYLSAITLFSVGYGDVVPLGIGRLFVMIEALLGYTIPATFVVRTVIDFEQELNKRK
ncbi:potassium channel family protein [Bacillus chungangensis]|uniref:Potassium channel LctB n=1 Tax=Bacillus chungangensis TaxID=587633 RepID=A0ABT9WRI7_9BACI|nr:potassium channel family protein [Bacillus chungangensis]MDQ0175714.1 potassium channel LctB [Bacillus chungangensis]